LCIFATLTFIVVNGMTFGRGKGPTVNEAKENAARVGLKCLRGIYGVEEGILMKKIERSHLFASNSPPRANPPSMPFDFVPEGGRKDVLRLVPILEPEGKDSFKPVSEPEGKDSFKPVSELEKKGWKKSIRKGMQRLWKDS
jgi:hypothetical protein